MPSSSPPPTSENVTLPLTIKNARPIASPSPGGEGRGEGEQPSAKGADFSHSRNGKIARLSHDIREQLNQRLHNGQRSPEILPWLNDLPPVKEILTVEFGGKPVNRQNLSNWRHSGYQCWLKEQSHITQISQLASYASGLSSAGSDSLAQGAATIAAAKILQYLDTLLASNASPDDLLKIVNALKPLLGGARGNARIKLAQERMRQREEQNKIQVELSRERIRQGDDKLLLMRDKHQRDVAAVSLRVLGDARAKEIEAAPIDNREQVELIGRHLFNRNWKHRPITAPEYAYNPPPNHPAQNSAGQADKPDALSGQG